MSASSDAAAALDAATSDGAVIAAQRAFKAAARNKMAALDAAENTAAWAALPHHDEE